ncbi:MAG: hypothetical protein GY751_02390 [Bacteroidetes bacterium]|nr:hypothetical protein [Bacteroidota bacterium]
MGTLFATENVKLAEKEFGILYLYLKNTTVELHEDYDYDLAVSFDSLSHEEIKDIANAILAWIEPNDSIE